MSEAGTTSAVVTATGRFRTPEFLARPIAEPLSEAVAVIALCPIFLTAAFWNGFPFVFYDTGAYMFQGFADRFVPERSPVFSLFVRYGGGGVSLWLVAILQVLLTSFVIVEMARALSPRMKLATMLAIGVGLAALTALPWHAAEIEPDCFTALLVLSLYLLAFHASKLGRGRVTALVVIGALSIACHPSHIGLAAGLVLATALYQLFVRTGWPRARLLLPVASTLLAVAMIFGANFHYTRHVFLSRAGGVFAMARMMQDGIITKVLNETCAQADYKLCQYRTELPKRADQYLWGPRTPFNKLGRFIGTEKESNALVRESLIRHPFLNLAMAAKDSAEQFVVFQTGDGIDPQQWIVGRDFRIFMPTQLPAYDLARQQKGDIPFVGINVIHLPVAVLALVLLIVCFGLALRGRDRRSAVLFGFVLAALIGNAIVCGAMSGPHGRYQSRLMWTPLLALVLVGSERPSWTRRLEQPQA